MLSVTGIFIENDEHCSNAKQDYMCFILYHSPRCGSHFSDTAWLRSQR